jgi:uncharacterized protein YbaP (TraB family)
VSGAATLRAWLGALLAVLTLAGAALAAPPVWEVKSPTATVYLFGTIHAMTPGANWRSPALDDAYAKSQVVWFETDVAARSNPVVVLGLVQRYGLDPQHPLSGKLDAAHLAALKAALAADNLPVAGLDRLRPWAASLLMLAAPMVRSGFDPKAGADMQLSAAAVADHKTVRAFETLDQQIRFFADLPPDAEVQLLDQAIDENGQTGEQVKAMETAWLDGDLDRLGPFLIGDMQTRYAALYATLILNRNRAWADTLAVELGGHSTELVNVGALHMVGADGLPALLKARGFVVRRLP